MPPEQRLYEVNLLDLYDEIASVKAVSAEYVDYMHPARWDGRWQILNVLWTDRVPAQ